MLLLVAFFNSTLLPACPVRGALAEVGCRLVSFKFMELHFQAKSSHYFPVLLLNLLGKEMVQNLAVLRFSNRWLEKIWTRNHIQCVMITFKDAGDVGGRGGYFDKYGIIRDIIQNHLFQIMCLVAMEAPHLLEGPESAKAIRDAKLAVLNAITDIKPEDVMIGQYDGYLDDPTVKNKESTCATFAAMRIFINTPRWAGVPFILKAGKALDDDKAEIRIQFKDSQGAKTMFAGEMPPRNEFGKFTTTSTKNAINAIC
jgi:glucose-6-phosphate 1-dehydrogenase